MEKPLIAMTLSGILVKKEPWKRAHMLWFQKAAEQLNNDAILDWIPQKESFFEGVDIVMRELYPNLDEEKRRVKARQMFFDAVVSYIEQTPQSKNKEAIEFLCKLKEKYRLGLITTNSEEAVRKILTFLELPDLFDAIATSQLHEVNDKKLVMDRFIKRYGKPLVYIGGGDRRTYQVCKELGLPAIYANLESDDDIEDVETVFSLEDLKEKLERLK